MNGETIQTLLNKLAQAQIFTDESFARYQSGYQALTDAKAMKYDIQTDEAGQTIVTPLANIMKDIERESDFVPTAKTKDERTAQLKAHLLATDPLYRNCLRKLERAELAILNATRQKDTSEKDYGRAHTKVFALQLEVQVALARIETENIDVKNANILKEAEITAARHQTESLRSANLEKELRIETMRKETAKIQHETAQLQTEAVNAEARIVAVKEEYEANVVNSSESTENNAERNQ